MNLLIECIIQDEIEKEIKLGQYARDARDITLQEFIKAGYNKALMLFEEAIKTNQLLATDSHWLSVARQRDFYEEIHKIRSVLTI